MQRVHELVTQFPEHSSVLAYPMHGQHKLVDEGYRTRDGHLIEWFSKSQSFAPVTVVSRPEPFGLVKKVQQSQILDNSRSVQAVAKTIPNLRDRRRWWVKSSSYYPAIPSHLDNVPAIVWNPFVAIANRNANPFLGRVSVLDLLDDWTIHYAFATIRTEVDEAYRNAFEQATYVTANAEGTAALARRFGREDVFLIPNGVDPERFSTRSRATGPLTVGYVGKIGRRLNLDLIIEVASALPDIQFVFAGPILDKEYRPPMEAAQNIELLGDVHYDDVPNLLERFDIGWVPHNVGAKEVGGDVIKTYEYRAAGLPVLATPIAGVTKRGLDFVNVIDASGHASFLAELQGQPRVERQLAQIPIDATWQYKSNQIWNLLGQQTNADGPRNR